jgi:hypothetical protein
MSYDGFSYFAFVFSTDQTLRDDSNIQKLLTKVRDAEWKFLEPTDSSHLLERSFLQDTPNSIINAWREAIKTGKYGATIKFCDSGNFVAGLGLDFEHQYRKLLEPVMNFRRW